MVYLLEKDIEELIFDTDSDTLLKRGLPLYENVERQKKFIGGKIDLLAHQVRYAAVSNTENIKSIVDIQLVEIKRDAINFQALDQILGYKEHLLKQLIPKLRYDHYTLELVLIGLRLDNTNFKLLLPHLTSDISIYLFEFKNNILTFKKQ